MNSRGGRLRRASRVLLVPLLLGLWIISDTGPVEAVHAEEFQLESAMVANPNPKPGDPAQILQGQANTVDDGGDSRDYDWENFFDSSGPTLDGVPNTINEVSLPLANASFVASGSAADFMTPDDTAYATGSKDDIPLQNVASKAGDGWQCKSSNNLGPKFDLLNAGAVAYRRPGDNHLIVYFMSEISSPNGDRNAGFWFLKDPTADCVQTAGGNKDWTGQHRDGDVLVVAGFSDGGKTAEVDAYRWTDPNPNNNTDADGSLVPQGNGNAVVGNECGSSDHLAACAVANEANEVNTPWASPDADGGNLNANEFVEGGIDLTAATGESCFATAVANSRSSTSAGSTVHDFARFSFQTCGDLKIVKYVDLDGDGSKETGEPAGRWFFEVFIAGTNTNPVCSGTTNESGELMCSAIPAGNYDVYETQVAGFYNTQRGGTSTVSNVAKPVATNIATGVGATTVTFGNICYVDKTFRINNVPEDGGKPSSITVQYSVNDGSYTNLNLAETQTVGRWEASVNDTFLQTDEIDWRWYINGDTGSTVTGGTNESLNGANPTSPSSNPPTDAGCQIINQDSFDLVPLSGKKFKDANGDGSTTGDPGLAGFQVTLHRQTGANTYEVAASATGVSTCNDNPNTQDFECTEAPFVFTPASVAPGTYKVVETQVAGWRQTLPAAGANNTTPGTRPLTIALGAQTASVGDWANTPLSGFSMTFSPEATYPAGNGPKTGTAPTTGTITCTGNPGSQTNNTYTATSKPVGTYNCQLVIVDP